MVVFVKKGKQQPVILCRDGSALQWSVQTKAALAISQKHCASAIRIYLNCPSFHRRRRCSFEIANLVQSEPVRFDRKLHVVVELFRRIRQEVSFRQLALQQDPVPGLYRIPLGSNFVLWFHCPETTSRRVLLQKDVQVIVCLQQPITL